jgi:hypothetical protein
MAMAKKELKGTDQLRDPEVDGRKVRVHLRITVSMAMNLRVS